MRFGMKRMLETGFGWIDCPDSSRIESFEVLTELPRLQANHRPDYPFQEGRVEQEQQRQSQPTQRPGTRKPAEPFNGPFTALEDPLDLDQPGMESEIQRG